MWKKITKSYNKSKASSQPYNKFCTIGILQQLTTENVNGLISVLNWDPFKPDGESGRIISAKILKSSVEKLIVTKT